MSENDDQDPVDVPQPDGDDPAEGPAVAEDERDSQPLPDHDDGGGDDDWAASRSGPS